MSVNLNKSQNVWALAALVVGTLAAIAVGLSWLEGPLIEEVAYAIVVLIVALVLYDKSLVQ